ncbi:Stage II sporulation protein M [Alkalibacterium gilvum]|uniref:Stage II sporulation protein M n=1 Tax=Alkalibacterium gilvum TaxID=1130080 RepID=A0A1H6U3E1_9LACT|nr:stage II sporulation protein M [Alkalibacterium gilvum]SEI86878.1 Stage II sporulation protein M [Alkalibacterium gilvum]
MKKIISIPFVSLFIGIITGFTYGSYSLITLNPQLTTLRFFPLVTHNLKVGIFIFLGGIITFSILSLSILILNGFSLGLALSALITNYEILFIIKYLLIHGVIELLGFICVAVGSMCVTYHVVGLISNKFKKEKPFFSNSMLFLKRSLLWTLSGTTLIVVAALIEVIII